MIVKNCLIVAAMGFVGLLTANSSSAKPIVIAVLDTGIDKNVSHLCDFGHRSFTETGPLVDEQGHGTHIASIISKIVGKSDNYCIVSIKWSAPEASGDANLSRMVKAVQYANNIKADYLNISADGSPADSNERKAILSALNRGATVIAAAGNEGVDLDKTCIYYPACYDNRIIAVGNLARNQIPGWLKDYKKDYPKYYALAVAAIKVRHRNLSSNYGHYVKRWEIGTDVTVRLPSGVNATKTGTSQATAVATAKLVRNRLNR